MTTTVKHVHSIQHPPTCKVLPKICGVNFDPIVCGTGNNVCSQTKEENNTITLKQLHDTLILQSFCYSAVLKKALIRQSIFTLYFFQTTDDKKIFYFRNIPSYTNFRQKFLESLKPAMKTI